jgi:hypothetical protein
VPDILTHALPLFLVVKYVVGLEVKERPSAMPAMD